MTACERGQHRGDPHQVIWEWQPDRFLCNMTALAGRIHGNRVNQKMVKWRVGGKEREGGGGADVVWCCRQLQTAFYLSLSDSCFQSTREAQSPVVPTSHYLSQTVICSVCVCVYIRRRASFQTAVYDQRQLHQHSELQFLQLLTMVQHHNIAAPCTVFYIKLTSLKGLRLTGLYWKGQWRTVCADSQHRQSRT